MIVESKMVAEFEIAAGLVMIVGTVGLYERSGARSSGS